MPDFFDRSAGEVVPLEGDAAKERFLAGKLATLPGVKYAIKKSDGTFVRVAPEDIEESLRIGGTFATGEEVGRHVASKKPVEAFSKSVMSDLTGGVSDALSTDPEGDRFLREENPGATLLGTGAAVIAGQGRGALARASMPGLAAAAQRSVTRATQRALQDKVKSDVARKAISLGAGSAVEGTIYGAKQTVTEAALGQTEDVTESLVANMGMGALLGGGFGAAIPVAAATGKSTGSLIGRAWGVSEEATLWDKMVNRINAFNNKAVANNPELALELRTKAGLERAKAALIEPDTARQNIARGFRDHIDAGVLDADDAIMEGAREKIRNLPKKVIEGNEPQVAIAVDDAMLHMEAAMKEIDSIQSLRGLKVAKDLRKAHADLEADLWEAAGYGKRGVNRPRLQEGVRLAEDGVNFIPVQGRFLRLSEVPVKTDFMAKSFQLLDRFKYRIDKSFVPSLKRASNLEAQDMLGFLIRGQANGEPAIRKKVMDLLEEDLVYGQAAVEQKTINELRSQYHNLREDASFDKAFLGKNGKADAGKINSWLNNYFGIKGDQPTELLNGFMQRRKALVDKLDEIYELPPEVKAKIARIRNNDKKLLALQKQADDVITVQNHQKAVLEAEAQGFGGGLFAAGPIVGLALGGVPGMAAGFLLQQAVRPGRSLEKLINLERQTGDIKSYMRGKIENAFRGTRTRVPKLGRTIVPTTLAMQRASTLKEKNEAHQKKMEEVRNYGELVNNAHRRTRQVADAAPQLAASLPQKVANAYEYLLQQAPVSSQLTAIPGRPDLLLSESELDRFTRITQAVEDPMSLLDKLGDGTLTREEVVAFETVYPKRAEEVKELVMEELIARGEEIPYHKRVHIGTTWNLVTDPSIAPEAIQRQQELHIPPTAEETGRATGRRKGLKPPKIQRTENMLSEADEIEAKTG